jgi:protein-disulfide isomerase
MAEEEKTITLKLPSFDIWRITTIVLAVALLLLLVGWPINLRGEITGRAAEAGLTADQAKTKAIDYINDNLAQPGTTATAVSVEDIGAVYKIITSYQGQQIPVYLSKDGTYLFLSAFNTSEKRERAQEEQPQTITKTDKPTVELYVMSFCPFGIQAENAMKPVVDLLGTKADFKVRFIVNVQGTTVDSVRSLHGTNEAMEDLRQACVMKYYDQKTFWTYLMEINANCPSVYRDASAMDTCWKNAAKKAGIDAIKIATCSNSTEGLNLLKADEQATQEYGVTGSPTLIINGVRYSGARTPEAFKQAICSAFTTAPSECSQVLSSSSGSASTGGC